MAKPRTLAALALALLVAACASTPPQSRLQTPSQFTQVDASAQVDFPPVRWWGVFDDPQLDALIRAAFEHNRDLQMAVERVERARALNRADLNALLPVGSATATAARARIPAIDGMANRPQVVERVGASVGATWEIDLFGRLRGVSRASGLEAGASAADVDALRSVLLADTAAAYFAWQGLRAQIEALTAIIDGQEQQLKLARARFDLGATDELDPRRASSELRTSEASLATLKGELTQVASRIAILSGRFPGELELQAREAGPPQAKPLTLGTPQRVLTQRPDVAAAELRLKAATARSDAAWAEMLPRLTFGGSVGLLAGSASDLSGDAARAWSLQPALTIPLLDLLQLAPLRAAREAESRIALAAYEKAMLTAVADVEASAASYRATTERVVLLSSRRDDAARALQIAEARFAAGSIDQLALIDAQRTRRSAALELAAAIAEHRVAVVELYRALGSPADFGARRAAA
jgi:NodT family efflux transporter outer membrane factor (OMF) lipoprotein